jgi:hypothetical protein
MADHPRKKPPTLVSGLIFELEAEGDIGMSFYFSNRVLTLQWDFRLPFEGDFWPVLFY